MNREKRRALKKALKSNDTRTRIANVLDKLGDDINDFIHDGDMVTLNIDRIVGRADYHKMQEGYRQFVESNRGKVFVARSHNARPDGFSAIMELDGVDWTFWYGDLIRVENIQTGEDE